VSGNDGLWTFFITGALTVAVALGAMAAFLVLSQRRTIALHRKYAHELLRAQEAERAHVGRELHDDVLQHLAHLGHDLEAIETASVGTETRARLSAVHGELDDVTQTIRKLSHGLHPSGLSFGLGPALDRLVESFGEEGLAIKPEVHQGPTGLDRQADLALYRIAQESLRNIRRHAGVESAELSLRRADGQVVLEVRDQGKGFQPHAARGGVGLHSIRERMVLVGGTATVLSQPGRGTTIRASVPIQV
jgi:two-component system sensor histidine kinase UhpB